MTRQTPCLRLFLLLTLGFSSLSFGYAQAKPVRRPDNAPAIGYAFVSPNTRENLTLEEARAGLNSPEEARLISEAWLVGCRLHKSLTVQKAVGSWSDGAEYSTIIRAQTNKTSLRYAGSWLGKFANQKAILYFRKDFTGPGRMYVLYLPSQKRDMATVSNELETSGIANRTLAPQRRRLLVYVVDLKNELKAKVLAAAKRLRARLTIISGEGDFIGDDDRQKAQQIFEQEITEYEKAHRVRKDCKQNR